MSTPDATLTGASARAIRFHYDQGNEFFALWLDPSYTYSCAYWEDGDTLEAAQMRKLDFMAAHARLDGAARVLDIGCGWGSMLRRLVERYGVRHAVGLTLSAEQHRWIDARGDPGIACRLEPWQAHRPGEPYDAIVSIGAFEHFARPGLPPEEKLAVYRRFFAQCHAWLRRDARLCLQTVCLSDASTAVSRFVSERIFPESDLPTLAQVCQAAEGPFEIVLVRNDREHYERTCKAWLARLKDSRDRARAIAGAEVVERYEQYLNLCCIGFHTGAAGLLRVALQRRG